MSKVRWPLTFDLLSIQKGWISIAQQMQTMFWRDIGAKIWSKIYKFYTPHLSLLKLILSKSDFIELPFQGLVKEIMKNIIFIYLCDIPQHGTLSWMTDTICYIPYVWISFTFFSIRTGFSGNMLLFSELCNVRRPPNYIV